MKEVLQPLALIPGVRIASLISEDGVPIVSTRGVHASDEDGLPLDRDDELNAFTALASGWFADLQRAVDRLSWSSPRRVVLRASRGELVLLQAPTAVVLVVLERGVSAEDLRVPMEGALARMQRLFRQYGGHTPDPLEGKAPIHPTPGPLPGAAGPDPSGASVDSLAHRGSEPSGHQ